MYDWCLLGYVLVLDYLFMCLMMSTKCCLWSVLEMSSRYYLVWLATRIEGMLTSPVCGLLGEKKNQIPSKDERKVEMAKQESSQLTGSIDGDLHVTSMVLHQRFLWASMHLLLTKSFSERREKEMREELAHAHLCVACWEKIQIVASKERVKKAEPTVVGLQARLQWWTCFFISMVQLKHSLWPAKHLMLTKGTSRKKRTTERLRG